VYRGPAALVRGPRAAPGGPVAELRELRLVAARPWPLVRDPWAGGRAWCALVPGPWPAIRAPWCACLVAELSDLVRGPWRVRPGGPRPWRVRLVAWPTAPGPRPPVPGPPPPAPGPKNGPRRVLRGHLPDFTLSVVPKTVFRILVPRETSSWKKGPL